MLVYNNGGNEKTLHVCRFCRQDLELLGFNALQVVRLEASKPFMRIPLSLIVLGPVYTLLED